MTNRGKSETKETHYRKNKQKIIFFNHKIETIEAMRVSLFARTTNKKESEIKET
jgi:hypothetical protein